MFFQFSYGPLGNQDKIKAMGHFSATERSIKKRMEEGDFFCVKRKKALRPSFKNSAMIQNNQKGSYQGTTTTQVSSPAYKRSTKKAIKKHQLDVA